MLLSRCAVALLLALLAADAVARIKLTTLPVRERVDVQLDHPQLSLVEEERIVPLVRGVNQVDFSWAGTAIDPATLLLRVLSADPADGGDAVDVQILSVSYPPGEAALVWSLSASAAAAARVRISYVLGGLGERFHYRALANADETELTLSQYLRVDNAASEGYDAARVWAGVGDPVAVSIGLGESKEVLLEKFRRVPVRKLYLADAAAHGYLNRAKNQLNVPLHYVLRNEAAAGADAAGADAAGAGLGGAPLPYGKVRIFQDDGRGGSAFLGEDWGEFVPVGGELSLYLGLARDVVVKRTIARFERSRIDGDLYRYDVVVRYQIENYKNEPATLRLVENAGAVRREAGRDAPRPPEWTLGTDHTLGVPDAELGDAERMVFHVELPARGADDSAVTLTHDLHLVLHNEW